MKRLNIVILSLVMLLVIHTTVFASMKQLTTLDSENITEWPVKISEYGGNLLLSDSPETVPADGIMYQDTVKGDTRLFFHHVNGTTEPKKIVVVLENTSSKTANITVTQYGLGGPGYDYLQVGKKVQNDYMNNNNLYMVEVPAGEIRTLIPELDNAKVEPNMLVNGMYDFTTDSPVKVKVMMMPLNADVKKFASEAKVLPTDQYRLRGTFAGKDRMVVSKQAYDAKKDGMVGITLADNVLDRYVAGIDATDGSKTVNYGNYGVVYNLFLPASHDSKISYYLNPRGGEYAGFMGVEYRHQEDYAVGTPADRMSFGNKTVKDVSYIGTYEGPKSLWLTFSPPGASNLPIKLVIKPEN